MSKKTIQINLDDANFQIALDRAKTEGTTLEAVVAEFLQQYADGASGRNLTTYTVQRGDTLGRIAVRFYGDARKYPIIQRANNIANASRIWIGQVLVIPAISNGTAASPSPPVVSPVTPPPPPAPISPPPTSSAPVPVQPTPPPARPAPENVAAPGDLVTTATGKPDIRWVGSPNFNNRRRPDDISAIVIHSTANSTLQGVIDWFNKPSSQVSAHYSIGKDGQIVQHVQDIHRAWHAGRSTWKGREGVNDYGLGIELVNLNNGQDPYPEVQHQANVALCAYLAKRYNVDPSNIMGHVDICLPPGRKSDPRGYDLDRLRREVAARLS